MNTESQRGVALLTILLLVVSITVVAGSMLASQKIAIRRSGVLFEQNQLLQDIDAGQQLAVMVIQADSQLNDTDSEQDIWAQPIPPYPVGAHSITVELRDEASRFNVNNLYQNGRVNTAAFAVFQRLLTQLNLAPDIATAVLDYQDRDHEVYQDGGDEEVVYGQSSRTTATKTVPNQPLVSIDQLQDIQGVSAEALTTLRPYITATPYHLPININTASPVLLAALIDGASSEQMQMVTDLRKKQAFTAVESLWQLPSFSGLNKEQQDALAPLLAVDSGAFMALISPSAATEGGQTRQRFATVWISKRATDNGQTQGRPNVSDADISNANDTTRDNDNSTKNNKATSSSNNHQAKQVQVIMRRLWAFRPSF